MFFQSPRLISLLVALVLVPATAPTGATEIYKWVAEDGSTHYSESLPDGELAGLEVLEVIPASSRLPSAANSYQSALDMATSMQADRLARERVRLEKERLRQQERRAREAAQRYNEAYTSTSYPIPYYRYPYRPYRRPPHHGKHPGYPPTRPPPGPYRVPSVPKRVYLNR